MRRDSDVLLVIVLYIDDMSFIGPNEKHIVEFKSELNSTFEMLDVGSYIVI